MLLPRVRLAAPRGTADDRRLRRSTCDPADVDETASTASAARDYALRVARAKAARIAGGCRRGRRHPGRRHRRGCRRAILGKPVDDADAASMLRSLSGPSHEVLTAVVLVCRRRRAAKRSSERRVSVSRPLTRSEIAWYIASGEPMRQGRAPMESRAWRRGSSSRSTDRGRTSSGCQSRPFTGCCVRAGFVPAPAIDPVASGRRILRPVS